MKKALFFISAVLPMSFLLPDVQAQGGPAASTAQAEPTQEKWSFGGEARFRFEARENTDLSSTFGDDNRFVLARVRVNMAVRPIKDLEAFIQPQFSGVWGEGKSIETSSGVPIPGQLTSGGLNDPDLGFHQGYVAWRLCPDFALKLGRQEMSYGDEVLVGRENFSNVGRAFDALQLHLFPGSRWLDVFYAKVVDDDVVGSGFPGERDFGGLYSSVANVGPLDVWDFYGLWYKQDLANFSPTYHFGTIGMRLSDVFKERGDLRIEAAAQVGEVNDGAMMAYMFDAEFGYTFPIRDGLRLAGEYNYASGDDPTEGDFTRFHPLFPSAHKWLGNMDLFGRQNIQSGVFHSRLNLDPKWTASADVHSFWRSEENDVVYSTLADTPYPGLGALPTSKENHVGEELDLVLGYKINNVVALEAMGGLFFPGAYMEDELGDGDLSYFSYLQATFSL